MVLVFSVMATPGSCVVGTTLLWKLFRQKSYLRAISERWNSGEAFLGVFNSNSDPLLQWIPQDKSNDFIWCMKFAVTKREYHTLVLLWYCWLYGLQVMLNSYKYWDKAHGQADVIVRNESQPKCTVMMVAQWAVLLKVFVCIYSSSRKKLCSGTRNRRKVGDRHHTQNCQLRKWVQTGGLKEWHPIEVNSKGNDEGWIKKTLWHDICDVLCFLV